MTAKALTRAEISRMNEIYQEMGWGEYKSPELQSVVKAQSEVISLDDLQSLENFAKNYQDLLLA